MPYPHPAQPLSPSSAYPNSGPLNSRQHSHHQLAPMPSPPIHRPPHLHGHSDSKQLQPPLLEHGQAREARRTSYMPSSVSSPMDLARAGQYHYHPAPGSSPHDSCSNSGYSSPMPHSKSSSSKSSHQSLNLGLPEAGPGHYPQPQCLLNGHALPHPRASLQAPLRHRDNRPVSVVEPKNLLGSVPTPHHTMRPLSMCVEPQRIVTGILQSALPVGSRPVPVVVTPTRSMSIQELQERHKLALQKLQTQGNRSVARDEAAFKQAAAAKSAKQTSPRPRSPWSPGLGASAMVEKSGMLEKVAKVEKPVKVDKPGKVEKPVKVENPAKVEKATKEEKASKRKSIFGFFGSKDPSGSRTAEEKVTKKAAKEPEEGGSAKESDSDEDVPLAQLRRANCAARPSKPPLSASARRPPLSHLTASGQPDRSLSAPGQRRPLSHQSTRSNSVGMFAPIPEDPNPPPRPMLSPNHRIRPLSQLSQEFTEERLVRSMSDNVQGLVSPGMVIGARSSGAMGHGPRPAILEAEEKALRNSRRAVAGLNGVSPSTLRR